MKKTIIVIASLLVVACGPSKAELEAAARAQAELDSTKGPLSGNNNGLGMH